MLFLEKHVIHRKAKRILLHNLRYCKHFKLNELAIFLYSTRALQTNVLLLLLLLLPDLVLQKMAMGVITEVWFKELVVGRDRVGQNKIIGVLF